MLPVKSLKQTKLWFGTCQNVQKYGLTPLTRLDRNSSAAFAWLGTCAVPKPRRPASRQPRPAPKGRPSGLFIPLALASTLRALSDTAERKVTTRNLPRLPIVNNFSFTNVYKNSKICIKAFDAVKSPKSD